MLIIAGTFTFDPDKLDDVVALQAPLVEEVRAEAGCQEYVFTIDPHEPGTQRLFEIWDDEDSLAAHARAPHMVAYRAAMQELGAMRSREVRLFEVSGDRSL